MNSLHPLPRLGSTSPSGRSDNLRRRDTYCLVNLRYQRSVGRKRDKGEARDRELEVQQHSIPRVRFVQMNLFRPAMRKEAFDVVLCNGVLHHTKDPFGGFQGLVPLVKPGGYFVVGLYNQYGRLMTDFRRILFRLTAGRARWLDPYLRSSPISDDKRRAWFADQYQHPHESKHTVGEVLQWFDECGLDFVRGIPSPALGEDALDVANLFEEGQRGGPLAHFLTQLKTVATGNREGGFFIMIGQKPKVAFNGREA